MSLPVPAPTERGRASPVDGGEGVFRIDAHGPHILAPPFPVEGAGPTRMTPPTLPPNTHRKSKVRGGCWGRGLASLGAGLHKAEGGGRGLRTDGRGPFPPVAPVTPPQAPPTTHIPPGDPSTGRWCPPGRAGGCAETGGCPRPGRWTPVGSWCRRGLRGRGQEVRGRDKGDVIGDRKSVLGKQ